jgi:hypothetical protein
MLNSLLCLAFLLTLCLLNEFSLGTIPSQQVLLEKILRSLSEVGTVYILVRPKKGRTVNERLSDVLSSRCFSFHSHSQTQVSKVTAVEGDVTLPFFGLSPSDLEVITSSVSVIIHAAASIRFDSLLASVFGRLTVLLFHLFLGTNLFPFLFFYLLFSSTNDFSLLQTAISPFSRDNHDSLQTTLKIESDSNFSCTSFFT